MQIDLRRFDLSKALDLAGVRFGRWTAVDRNLAKQTEQFERTGHQTAYWNCICDCGSVGVVATGNLTNGMSKSCGCYGLERRRASKNVKFNEWRFEGECAIGVDHTGREFIIDKSDYEIVSKYCWRVDPHGYVVANQKQGTNRVIKLHRVLMDALPDEIIDHRDQNKLNNTRSNLRKATKGQNNANIKRRADNTTGYTGVKLTSRGKYQAQISANGKRYYLGTFDALEDAVNARHYAEQIIHGEWSGEINRKDFEKIMGREEAMRDEGA